MCEQLLNLIQSYGHFQKTTFYIIPYDYRFQKEKLHTKRRVFSAVIIV